MTVEFATPLGALVAVLALVPLGAAIARERRFSPVRASLGLSLPERRLGRGFLVAAALVFALLGLAAAQPLLVVRDEAPSRTDAEAFVLIDSSRSMLASAGPGSATRFERAAAIALRLRVGLGDVPVGVASITDRPLPHLFPTVDRDAFAAVVRRAVGVDRPPPAERGELRATDLGSLVAFGRDNYFSSRSVHRLVLVLTDGESRRFDPDSLASQLRRDGVSVVTVRLWGANERVFRPDGEPEAAYAPDDSGEAQLARLAAAMPGGRVFGEQETQAAVGAARLALGEGPVVSIVEQERRIALGGWIALGAAVPLAILLVRRPPLRLRFRPSP